MAVSPSVKARVMAKYPACLACGATEYLAVDHVISLNRGGDDGEANLQTLCRRCNSGKGANCVDYRQSPPLVIFQSEPKGIRFQCRLSDEMFDLLESLESRLGTSKTEVVERGLRCLATNNGTPANRLPGGGMLTAETSEIADDPTPDGEFRYPMRGEG